ncbi:MAG: hypothetical protein HRT73_07300 [Flavobacteriales bacterium]|nr:hypothetical protein [Flavobacteriales bacterium]NQX97672.1 hypothetical protein [Flavobacteriales bacterium]
MKRNYIYTLGILLVIAITIGACSKEDVSPRLIIHVQEANGTPAVGATVHAWYGNNAQQNGSVLDEDGYDQTGTTDGAGDVTFEFKASAVLDIDIVEFIKTTTDGGGIVTSDTLSGHKVVKIEAVRQSSDDNDFNETVIVK